MLSVIVPEGYSHLSNQLIMPVDYCWGWG